MKKITFFLTAILLLSFFSCKKDETKATVKSPATTPVLNLQEGATIVLKITDREVPINYDWSAADFGQPLVISYNLQMDKQGNDFADPVSLGVVTNVLTLSILTDALNNKLLAMEPDPSLPVPLDVEFRVQASVSTYYTPANSVVIHQTITPYYVPIVYPILFVPGSYQGWNPADSSTIISSALSNDKYEGYIWFSIDNAEFKYTLKNNWDINWGDNGGDGSLELNGANIVAGAAGYYKLNVDLVALTHKFLLTSWSIVGDASGSWDVDKDLTYDEATQTWTVTLPLTAAGMKFRANHAWDLNYGDNAANGTLQENGANIMVPSAGTYLVTLNLSKPIYRYKLELQKK
jgi:hypothetical protein